MIFLLAVLTLQWQLIARINNIMQLAMSTLLINYREPFTLHIKMCWSKIFRTERQSPTQILFASMDPIVCPLLNISILMETVGSEGGGLIFGKTNKTAANLLKQVYQSAFLFLPPSVRASWERIVYPRALQLLLPVLGVTRMD